MRAGIGYDVHPLTPGRKLILGGVPIPYLLGLAGHSDADVLLHAITDALLGAAALGDIGHHFPPEDPQYKDISSRRLLARAWQMVSESGFRISNIDATVVAQQPRLAPHVPAMVAVICETLGLASGRVSIKATTTEGLGFAGRSEGIAAYAVVTLEE